MQKIETALFVVLLAWPLAACDKKAPPTTSAPSASAAAKAAPKGPSVPTGGDLDLEVDDEAANVKVGPAYAVPVPREQGNIYHFTAFNAGATDTSCSTKINGDSPVGGDNWAVSLDMSNGAPVFKAGEKDKSYDDVTATVFFVSKSGPWKGKARGVNPFGEDAEKKLTIVSADDKTVTVKVDVSNKNGHVKGEFKAMLCPPAP